MTTSIIPTNGWRLSGGQDISPRTAVVLRLPHARIDELRGVNRKAQLITNGSQPIIRCGTHTIHLNLEPETLTNEIYEHTAAADDDDKHSQKLTLYANATHSAKALPAARPSIDDDMLALEQSYARIAEEKASQTDGKNARGHGTDSPVLGASAPPSNAKSSKSKAIRHAVIHLLAMRPLSTEAIAAKVRISSPEVKKELLNLGRLVEGKWELSDKMYKELDPWRFKYPSDSDRQACIDHAVKAYDRMRLSKDDKLWQTLLPKAERGKGKVLSKWETDKQSTQKLNSSPAPGSLSAVNSPQLSAAGTPSHTSNKKEFSRLFAKDPKRARALAEAKEKRKAAVSAAEIDGETRPAKKQHLNTSAEQEDKLTAKRKHTDATKPEERPAKRQATATRKTAGNVKSQEFVHSSDEEPDMKTEVVHDTSKAGINSVRNNPSQPGSKASRPQPHPQSTGKLTPGFATNKTKTNISPPKALRPTVPSPLGAARPRVASDVSDRSGISQRRAVAEGPIGLGINVPARKRHDTMTDVDASERARPLIGKSASNSLKSQQSQQINGSASRKLTSSLMSGRTTQNTQSGGGSSDSSSSVADAISFSQGVDLAADFQDKYYPQYAKMYDSMAAKQQRGEIVDRGELKKLWDMHHRLKQMKIEIEAAAARQQRGSES